MRKKGRKQQEIPPYIVPLSVQAVEIVRYMFEQRKPAQCYVFPHCWDLKKRISENTLNGALKRIGYKDVLTGHGIRATISTALNEIGYPKVWVDAQLSHSDPDKVSSVYNHAEFVEQRRRMMQDWADRLDLFEQNQVEAASAHLSVQLAGVPAQPGEGTETSAAAIAPAPILLVTQPGQAAMPLPTVATRLPAVCLPRSGLQPEFSDIQRERTERLEIFNSTRALPAAVFAQAVGKSRRWISYEIKAGKVLALSMGNRGQRIPDWHLDPLKHRLIQAVLKHVKDADPWQVYRALSRQHDMLDGHAPIEAVTQANFHEAVMAVCFSVREIDQPSLLSA